jgi:4-alpha-glucanotransferase
MLADGFKWWIKRVHAAFTMFDVVRIDHFRGFAASWGIPGTDKTAERGRWVNVPGRELFSAIRTQLGQLPIIAEDLGVITPDVEELRDELNFPGMKVLQFAFGGDPSNGDLPHNYKRNLVVYTGTHDNDTTIGWFESGVDESSTREANEIDRERAFCLKYLDSDGEEINWDFIRAALSSVADTAITPLQDILGLGNDARMNLPNSTSGNWSWRFEDGVLTKDISARLLDLTRTYGR